jgi:nitroreductase
MLDTIRSRRSIRKFTQQPVTDDTLRQVIEMGVWAPSGLNNQPWKFVVIRDAATIAELSGQTRYSHIVKGAPACIAVFLDRSQSYDYVKDVQAMGACIQNMLLTVHHLGLGAVWLGEILKNKDAVAALLGAPQDMELMAVVALGYPAEARKEGSRKPVDESILYWK